MRGMRGREQGFFPGFVIFRCRQMRVTAVPAPCRCGGFFLCAALPPKRFHNRYPYGTMTWRFSQESSAASHRPRTCQKETTTREKPEKGPEKHQKDKGRLPSFYIPPDHDCTHRTRSFSPGTDKKARTGETRRETSGCREETGASSGRKAETSRCSREDGASRDTFQT